MSQILMRKIKSTILRKKWLNIVRKKTETYLQNWQFEYYQTRFFLGMDT